ncbi:DNA double-strand break repair nuclease NurA [Haloglycomyces albus]|uniref:DNA double-strand break repair nuclease NurA n=1 Tax=Haloglycomyces albus TaxID=526067 RepID=UPI0004A4303F|nr:DNA double-strand break repair nuclease NurA [Haloglycomyces albus]
MRITVDAWDPSFADGSESPGAAGAAELEVNVERPGADWAPITPTAPGPNRVAVVDGVRRLDARVELSDSEGRWPGLCVSWAAGLVTCDFAAAHSEVSTTRVQRGLFSPVDPERELGPYPYFPIKSDDTAELIAASQNAMSALEAEIALNAEETDLAVLDGTLRGRRHADRAIGYIKSHQRSYLPADLNPIVEQLQPAQRTPVFQLTTTWPRYCAYLRLPGVTPYGWNGIARLEAADHGQADDAAEAIRLVNSAAAVLPRLASSSHKDPRAPQNLTPIAGLERRLKHLMGDPRILLRTIRRA